MKQKDLKVGMRIWCIGTYDVIGGIISDISSIEGLIGCYVLIDDDPNNIYIGLNCYMRASELKLYNPNEPRPEPFGKIIPLDEMVWE